MSRAIRCAALLIAVPVFQLLHAQRASDAPASVGVQVENPLDIARPDEVIVVLWPTLAQQVTGITANRVRVIDGNGSEITSQVIDSNGDGSPDELLFQASLWPSETRHFRIEARAPAAAPRSRVYAYHDDPRDDIAWESDRIAFRTYGMGLWNVPGTAPLVSSGIDVWLKRTRDLVIDRWYGKGQDAYHADTGEGADFYSVGETLGAGGSAIWKDGELHRAKNFRSYRIIANGPIRAIFELQYDPWNAGGLQVIETKRITIDAGHNLFLQEITYRADADAIEYAVGTVKRTGLVGTTKRAGPWSWQSTWGPVDRSAGGHGSLGTAVVIERDRVVDMRETDSHYLVVARARPGEAARQYVGAGWTSSGDFVDVQAWWDYLDAFAMRMQHPVRVTLSSAGAASIDPQPAH